METPTYHASEQGAPLDGSYPERSLGQAFEKARNATIFGLLLLAGSGVGCKLMAPQLWTDVTNWATSWIR